MKINVSILQYKKYQYHLQLTIEMQNANQSVIALTYMSTYPQECKHQKA